MKKVIAYTKSIKWHIEILVRILRNEDDTDLRNPSSNVLPERRLLKERLLKFFNETREKLNQCLDPRQIKDDLKKALFLMNQDHKQKRISDWLQVFSKTTKIEPNFFKFNDEPPKLEGTSEHFEKVETLFENTKRHNLNVFSPDQKIINAYRTNALLRAKHHILTLEKDNKKADLDNFLSELEVKLCAITGCGTAMKEGFEDLQIWIMLEASNGEKSVANYFKLKIKAKLQLSIREKTLEWLKDIFKEKPYWQRATSSPQRPINDPSEVAALDQHVNHFALSLVIKYLTGEDHHDDMFGEMYIGEREFICEKFQKKEAAPFKETLKKEVSYFNVYELMVSQQVKLDEYLQDNGLESDIDAVFKVLPENKDNECFKDYLMENAKLNDLLRDYIVRQLIKDSGFFKNHHFFEDPAFTGSTEKKIERYAWYSLLFGLVSISKADLEHVLKESKCPEKASDIYSCYISRIGGKNKAALHIAKHDVAHPVWDFLVESKVDVIEGVVEDETPLMAAVKADKLRFIKYFASTDHGKANFWRAATYKVNNKSAFDLAAEGGHVDIVKLMVDQMVEEKGIDAVMTEAKKNNQTHRMFLKIKGQDWVEALIEKRKGDDNKIYQAIVKPDDHGLTPFEYLLLENPKAAQSVFESLKVKLIQVALCQQISTTGEPFAFTILKSPWKNVLFSKIEEMTMPLARKILDLTLNTGISFKQMWCFNDFDTFTAFIEKQLKQDREETNKFVKERIPYLNTDQISKFFKFLTAEEVYRLIPQVTRKKFEALKRMTAQTQSIFNRDKIVAAIPPEKKPEIATLMISKGNPDIHRLFEYDFDFFEALMADKSLVEILGIQTEKGEPLLKILAMHQPRYLNHLIQKQENQEIVSILTKIPIGGKKTFVEWMLEHDTTLLETLVNKLESHHMKQLLYIESKEGRTVAEKMLNLNITLFKKMVKAMDNKDLRWLLSLKNLPKTLYKRIEKRLPTPQEEITWHLETIKAKGKITVDDVEGLLGLELGRLSTSHYLLSQHLNDFIHLIVKLPLEKDRYKYILKYRASIFSGNTEAISKAINCISGVKLFELKTVFPLNWVDKFDVSCVRSILQRLTKEDSIKLYKNHYNLRPLIFTLFEKKEFRQDVVAVIDDMTASELKDVLEMKSGESYVGGILAETSLEIFHNALGRLKEDNKPIDACLDRYLILHKGKSGLSCFDAYRDPENKNDFKAFIQNLKTLLTYIGARELMTLLVISDIGADDRETKKKAFKEYPGSLFELLNAIPKEDLFEILKKDALFGEGVPLYSELETYLSNDEMMQLNDKLSYKDFRSLQGTDFELTGAKCLKLMDSVGQDHIISLLNEFAFDILDEGIKVFGGIFLKLNPENREPLLTIKNNKDETILHVLYTDHYSGLKRLLVPLKGYELTNLFNMKVDSDQTLLDVLAEKDLNFLKKILENKGKDSRQFKALLHEKIEEVDKVKEASAEEDVPEAKESIETEYEIDGYPKEANMFLKSNVKKALKDYTGNISEERIESAIKQGIIFRGSLRTLVLEEHVSTIHALGQFVQACIQDRPDLKPLKETAEIMLEKLKNLSRLSDAEKVKENLDRWLGLGGQTEKYLTFLGMIATRAGIKENECEGIRKECRLYFVNRYFSQESSQWKTVKGIVSNERLNVWKFYARLDERLAAKGISSVSEERLIETYSKTPKEIIQTQTSKRLFHDSQVIDIICELAEDVESLGLLYKAEDPCLKSDPFSPEIETFINQLYKNKQLNKLAKSIETMQAGNPIVKRLVTFLMENSRLDIYRFHRRLVAYIEKHLKIDVHLENENRLKHQFRYALDKIKKEKKEAGVIERLRAFIQKNTFDPSFSIGKYLIVMISVFYHKKNNIKSTKHITPKDKQTVAPPSEKNVVYETMSSVAQENDEVRQQFTFLKGETTVLPVDKKVLFDLLDDFDNEDPSLGSIDMEKLTAIQNQALTKFGIEHHDDVKSSMRAIQNIENNEWSVVEQRYLLLLNIILENKHLFDIKKKHPEHAASVAPAAAIGTIAEADDPYVTPSEKLPYYQGDIGTYLQNLALTNELFQEYKKYNPQFINVCNDADTINFFEKTELDLLLDAAFPNTALSTTGGFLAALKEGKGKIKEIDRILTELMAKERVDGYRVLLGMSDKDPEVKKVFYFVKKHGGLESPITMERCYELVKSFKDNDASLKSIDMSKLTVLLRRTHTKFCLRYDLDVQDYINNIEMIDVDSKIYLSLLNIILANKEAFDIEKGHPEHVAPAAALGTIAEVNDPIDSKEEISDLSVDEQNKIKNYQQLIKKGDQALKDALSDEEYQVFQQVNRKNATVQTIKKAIEDIDAICKKYVNATSTPFEDFMLQQGVEKDVAKHKVVTCLESLSSNNVDEKQLKILEDFINKNSVLDHTRFLDEYETCMALELSLADDNKYDDEQLGRLIDIRKAIYVLRTGCTDKFKFVNLASIIWGIAIFFISNKKPREIKDCLSILKTMISKIEKGSDEEVYISNILNPLQNNYKTLLE